MRRGRSWGRCFTWIRFSFERLLNHLWTGLSSCSMGRTVQAQRRVFLGSWDSDMLVMSRLSSLTARRRSTTIHRWRGGGSFIDTESEIRRGLRE